MKALIQGLAFVTLAGFATPVRAEAAAPAKTGAAGPAKTERGAPAQEPATPAKGQPAARVAGQTIDLADVDELIRPQLAEVRAHEYQLRSKALDELIARTLIAKEAAALGETVEALQKAEVDDKAVVSEAQAQAFYTANKSRMGNLTEADAMQQIRAGLAQQRRNELRAALAKRLRAKYPVQILIEPYRVPVDVADAPVRGNPKAPVTVVEFSDFQCPFCARARPVVQQVRDTYGDKVRWVFRHFPLSFHASAEKAGEAAACAQEQGKFWQMHDRIWADHTKLAIADLKADAAALGLDVAAFDKCLDSGQTAARIERDQEEGAGYGVSGTPAFFVNGRLLSGAQPFEAFQQVIDDELQRTAAATPPAPTK